MTFLSSMKDILSVLQIIDSNFDKIIRVVDGKPIYGDW